MWEEMLIILLDWCGGRDSVCFEMNQCDVRLMERAEVHREGKVFHTKLNHKYIIEWTSACIWEEMLQSYFKTDVAFGFALTAIKVELTPGEQMLVGRAEVHLKGMRFHINHNNTAYIIWPWDAYEMRCYSQCRTVTAYGSMWCRQGSSSNDAKINKKRKINRKGVSHKLNNNLYNLTPTVRRKRW